MMVLVSGPVSVYIFKINNKNVFLFGDIHTNQLVQSKKSVPITSFIDELPNTTDLFLESPYKTKQSKNELPDYESSSVMTTLYNHYKKKMYLHKRKNDKSRVHFTDIRQGTDLEFFMDTADSLIESLIKNEEQIKIDKLKNLFSIFPTMSKIVQYINLVVLSNDIKNKSETLLPDFDNLDMVTNLPNTNHKVHRIRKQILKLDKSLQYLLIKYHKDKCKNISNQAVIYNRIIKNAIKHNYVLNQRDALDLLVIMMSWNNHMKDMYTLARMLYYIFNGNDNIISYDGNQHTLNYVEFFERYMNKDTKLIYYQSLLDIKNKKYLKIPKFYV